MKVLNVIISLDRVSGGGFVERTFQMSRSLVKAGEECTILTTDIGLTPERMKELEGMTIVALPCLTQRFYVPKFDYRHIRDLVRNADVIHLMSHWSFLNALVYFIARRHNKPYVVCPAGVLLIYGRSRALKTLYNWVVGRGLIRNAENISQLPLTKFRNSALTACQRRALQLFQTVSIPRNSKMPRWTTFAPSMVWAAFLSYYSWDDTTPRRDRTCC